jgi:hypothetical protein
MIDRDQIERIVFQAIDSVNEMLLDDNAVPKEPTTILLGQGAMLDSMGFVNFIVALEEILAEETGLTLNLVEQLNVPGNYVPKEATVSTFVEFVFGLMQAKA